LGDSLLALKEGKPVQVGYDTRFLIMWPDHLGGGEITLELAGTMMLNPLLSFD
jgi:hypothetical protein